MSFYDNLPEFLARAGVAAQQVHPAFVSAENREFLKKISIESYTTRKAQISGILHEDNTVSNKTHLWQVGPWPRSLLDSRRGAFLFRTLFHRNFDTFEVSWLLMEAYLTQVQVNALLVGKTGFWRLVLVPIKSGENALVDAEMVKVLGKIMSDLRKVSPTSENITKALRGMGYVQYFSFYIRTELVKPRYLPSKDVVGSLLMAMSMFAGMLWYGNDGAVTINPEAPEHNAEFEVPPGRKSFPIPDLDLDLIKTSAQFKLVSPEETYSIFASPGWDTTAGSARPITAEDVFPDSVPRSISEGDAIIMSHPERAGGKYTFTFVKAKDIESTLKEGDTLMLAPPRTSDTPLQIRPDLLLTLDDEPLFYHEHGGIMSEMPRSPSSQAVDAWEVPPTRLGYPFQPTRFRRFALSGDDPKSLLPVQLTGQDAYELDGAEENNLVAWIDAIAKESAFQTYKATWTLIANARSGLIRTMPYIGPMPGSIHMDPQTPQVQLGISQDVEANGRLLGVTTPTPQERFLAATWVDHYHDPADAEQLQADLKEMIEVTLLKKHMPGRIAGDTVGIIKKATGEAARELYGTLAKMLGQAATRPPESLRRFVDYVASKVQQEAHSVRRKMLEDESRQFATLPHDQLGPRLQEMLESADQHAGHEHTPDERALQVEGIVRDIVSGYVSDVAGYIADVVTFIGRTNPLGPEIRTAWNEDQEDAAVEANQSVATSIGQALESVANGWKSIQYGTQQLMKFADGLRGLRIEGVVETPTQWTLSEDNQGYLWSGSATPEATFTSEDYALVRKLLNGARQERLKDTHERVPKLIRWYPLFHKYNDRLQRWTKIVEGAGGSRDFLPADALDSLRLAVAMRATYETYVDELALDAKAISSPREWGSEWYEQSEKAQQDALDLSRDVEEIFEFPKMVGEALGRLSFMAIKEREEFLLKAKSVRLAMVKEDGNARSNGRTSQYTDRLDLSRAVWDAMWPPLFGPGAGIGPQATGIGQSPASPFVVDPGRGIALEATGFAHVPAPPLQAAGPAIGR